MKNLGFGLMRLPVTKKSVKNDKIDPVQTAEMIKEFIGEGFTYFDTAYMYHAGKSEKTVGEFLTPEYKRESFLLADKMPVGMLVRKADTSRIFRNQLSRCKTDYFDYYLLHALNDKGYKKAEKLGVFDYLLKKKAEGKIKRLGFSFHDTAAVLDDILTAHPEMEFVQLQINYLDWLDPNVQSKLCYEVARKHGKDIIVMEPVKGGKLANLEGEALEKLRTLGTDASPASYAIRFVASLEGVIMTLSGMSNINQLKDNMSYMGGNFVPLSDQEKEVLFSVAEILNDARLIPCTECRYCIDGCPMEIPIADIFSLYNKSLKGDKKAKKDYESLKKEKSSPTACINCKKCENACPQKIEITAKLKQCEEKLN